MPRLPRTVGLIELPCYNTAVYVAGNRADYEAACAVFELDPRQTAGVTHLINNNETGGRFILIGLTQDQPDVDILAHECAHAALWVFSIIGEDMIETCRSNEPFAYLVGHLYREADKTVQSVRS